MSLRILTALTFLAWSSYQANAAAPKYDCVEIGDPTNPNNGNVVATAINKNDRVIGILDQTLGFVWEAPGNSGQGARQATFTPLQSQGNSTVAYGLSDDNDWVAGGRGRGTSSDAFRWKRNGNGTYSGNGGDPRDPGVVFSSGDIASVAVGVSSDGTVGGLSARQGMSLGFRWKDGVGVWLLASNGDPQLGTIAYGVGTYDNGGFPYPAVVGSQPRVISRITYPAPAYWWGSPNVALPNNELGLKAHFLPPASPVVGGNLGEAKAINGYGIVGYWLARLPGGGSERRLAFWKNSGGGNFTSVPLTSLPGTSGDSEALGLNEDTVVGYSRGKAFVAYRDGNNWTTMDLNGRVNNAPNVTFTSAVGITPNGAILVNAVETGSQRKRSFILFKGKVGVGITPGPANSGYYVRPDYGSLQLDATVTTMTAAGVQDISNTFSAIVPTGASDGVAATVPDKVAALQSSADPNQWWLGVGDDGLSAYYWNAYFGIWIKANKLVWSDETNGLANPWVDEGTMHVELHIDGPDVDVRWYSDSMYYHAASWVFPRGAERLPDPGDSPGARLGGLAQMLGLSGGVTSMSGIDLFGFWPGDFCGPSGCNDYGTKVVSLLVCSTETNSCDDSAGQPPP